MNITRRAAIKKILDMRASGYNKIWSVKNIRKNPKEGEDPEQTHVCRFGVTKGVTGKGMKHNPEDFQCITVYDVNKGGFRTLWLDSLLELTIEGNTDKVTHG